MQVKMDLHTRTIKYFFRSGIHFPDILLNILNQSSFVKVKDITLMEKINLNMSKGNGFKL